MQEVMSLFGFTAKNQALTENQPSRSLAISVVSAFFIVVIVAVLLSFTQQAISEEQTAVSSAIVAEESVAFQPGQYIRPEIAKGYLGR